MKKALFWILAVVITLASAVYQRKTGPTYPKEQNIEINGELISFELPRSHESHEDCLVEIPVKDSSFNGIIKYKRFPTNEEYRIIELEYTDSSLIGYLPKQAPAGKLQYSVMLNESEWESETVIIRYKGAVPAWALIPHIIFMFVAMLLSNLAGLFAAGRIDAHIFYGKLTLNLLVLGGLIFGPIVQHYAFGQAWTGVPFGWDLTDNKTLIAVVLWFIAVLGNRKSSKYRYTIWAAIILFLVYVIPHSMFGSELNYESGEVITGFVKTI